MDLLIRTPGTISWLEGLGQGFYGEKHDVVFGATLHSYDLADIDGDGDEDILVSQSSKLRWYKNEGGYFIGPYSISNGETSFNYSVAVDMDNDGDMDVVSAQSYGAMRLFENLGGGVFAFYVSLESGAGYPDGVSAADLDGDGLTDIVSYSSTSDQLSWNKNLGGMTVGLPVDISSTISGDAKPIIRDLDGDGDLDIMAVNNTEEEVVWFENTAAGNFVNGGLVFSYPTPLETKWYQQLRMADFNMDGADDLLVAENYDGEILYFTNDGTGSPSFTFAAVLMDNLDGATDANPIDLNGDGLLDLITASEDDGKIAVYKNLGGMSFGEEARLSYQLSTIESIGSADIDNDGDIDIYLSSNGSDRVSWLENNGNGSFWHERVIFDASDWASEAEAGDLDGDGDLDMVVTYGIFTSKISWFENLGAGNYGPENNIDSYSETRHDNLELGDLDGDGDLDLLMANSYSDEIIWYRNLGGGSFSGVINIASSLTNASDILAIDTDNDGDLDVVCATIISNEFFHYENLGGGVFTQKQHMNGIASRSALFAAADLDLDGDIDLAIASLYYSGWLENADGLFLPAQSIPGSVNNPRDLTTADLDRDGYADILIASRSDNLFSWNRNLGDGSFGDREIIADTYNGPWRILAADLDLDGDPEVLVGDIIGGAFSMYENLSKQPCVSEPVNLIHTFTPDGIEFYWDEVQSATTYQIRVRRMIAPKKSKYFFSDSNLFAINASFTPGDEYKWLLRAKCGVFISPWSTFDFFSIPGAKLASSMAAVFQPKIQLFPNPASEFVQVQLEGAASIEVFDLAGKLVHEVSYAHAGTVSISVSNWEKGSYLLAVYDANGMEISTEVLVKE